jgi:hypothetical protein
MKQYMHQHSLPGKLAGSTDTSYRPTRTWAASLRAFRISGVNDLPAPPASPSTKAAPRERRDMRRQVFCRTEVLLRYHRRHAMTLARQQRITFQRRACQGPEAPRRLNPSILLE